MTGIVQIAYHVADLDAAAARMAARFGWGPFYLSRHIPLSRAVYRGVETRHDHSSAYGQAGDVMVELVQQHDTNPSVFRELYAADQQGLHHTARVVPDLDAALTAFAGDGFVTAFEGEVSLGSTGQVLRYAMVDTVRVLGHFTELYARSAPLDALYGLCRASADGWDGRDPVREMPRG